MEVIQARNLQQAVPFLLQLLYNSGEEEDGDLVINGPVYFQYERPRERLVFWPGYQRNPAHELRQALQSLAQAEPSIETAGQKVKEGARHFLFSTPVMSIQAQIGTDGRFDLTCIVTEENPFIGALGQMALQMTILQELMAKAARAQVGTFSVQHMGLRARKDIVTNLLQAGVKVMGEDPYLDDLKPRTIDGPLQMQMVIEEGDKAVGYKSKWIRHVVLPLFAVNEERENPARARELCKKIKAEDWRRSMLDFIGLMESTGQFKEQTGGEEAN